VSALDDGCDGCGVIRPKVSPRTPVLCLARLLRARFPMVPCPDRAGLERLCRYVNRPPLADVRRSDWRRTGSPSP